MKAVWGGAVLAESDDTLEVEGNNYFPPDSIRREFFTESSRQTTCPWKGQASYYTLKVKGEENPDAAWYYPEPKEAANHIRDHIAFWKGVELVP